MKFQVKDLKTKGVYSEDGVKNYMITTPSKDVYMAVRDGSGYTIGDDGVRRTLKACKEIVASDSVVFFADAEKAPEDAGVDNTWQCVDPCALLILISTSGANMPEIKRTCDAHGWLTPDGDFDVVAAKENLEKWGIKG